MDLKNSDVLIVGAGAAGHSAATTLRRDGFSGTIRVVHDEHVAPYNRTLVDKGMLPGLLTPEQTALPALVSLGVEIVNGRAVAMDANARAVHLEDGRTLGFRALLLAVGSSPRSSGHDDVDGVFPLHHATDALRIRAHAEGAFAGRSTTILGAGLVGTEAASYFVGAGADVYLVARSDLPLAATLGVPVAARLRDLHRERTDFHGGRVVDALNRTSAGVEIRLDDGSCWESHLVVTAQGTSPATTWLPYGGAGIPVDGRLRADRLPHVYAAGGAAAHRNVHGIHYRVDHWEDATSQGVHAARTILHDLGEGEDPGCFRAVTGFSVSMYGSSVTGVGFRAPGTIAETTWVGEGIVTTFIERDGTMTGAVGWAAPREVQALRREITGRR